MAATEVTQSRGNPVLRLIKWWFTPLSTEQDAAFRERCLRWAVLISIGFSTYLFIYELAFMGSIAAFPDADKGLFLFVYLTYAACIALLIRGRATLAAYVFSALLMLNIGLDPAMAYWSPVTVSAACILMLFFALILPKNALLMLFVLLQAGTYFLHIAFPPGPNPLIADLYATPTGALTASAMVFVGGGVVVYLLLREYIRQRDQLKDLVETLEERVSERTRDLQVASDVARRATTVLDLDALLPELAQATKDGFGMYFVGVFLYERDRRRLAFKAGSGDEGRKIAGRSVSISIDAQPSLVAKAGREGTTVVANDVTQEAGFLSNPDLPNTKSEVDLPMVVANELIGVLSIQSDAAQRFSDEDLVILTTLAEQMAIAIKNAQLFQQQVTVAEELRRADQIKSQFLASMSHELRTPLNAILAFTKYMRQGVFGPVNEQQVDYLGKTVDSGEHLLSLINDVLDVTKIQSGMLKLYIEEGFNVTEEIEKIAVSAESMLKDKPVKLVMDVDRNLNLATCDRRRVRQIFYNLIANAVKFTEQGTITISAKQRDGELLFAVSDTGPGIALEDQTRIFEPFIQTETGIQHAGGTGLGLPISMELARAHGGRLWVESELGEGASFHLALPLTAAVSESEPETAK